jgi:hypothetical protein
MKNNPQRRNCRRHALNCKAAIAFAAASGKPVVHTQTQDISASGVAVLSDHDDLMGATVTVLRAAPSADDKKAPRMLKIPAWVVSTVRTPGMSQYRHGLGFIRSVGDRLSDLEALLQGMQEAAPRSVAVGHVRAIHAIYPTCVESPRSPPAIGPVQAGSGKRKLARGAGHRAH